MPDGSIKLLLQIDRENPPSTAVSDRIQLTVKATEIVPPGDDPFQSKQSQVGYPFSIETFISINIVDVDDNVPTFYKLTAAGNVDSKVETQAFTVDLSEDASVGSAVQNLNIFVEDLDKDENAHFFLKIDDSNVPFTLSVAEIFESSTVDVRIIGLEDLDYESDKKSYSFKIQAVDSTDSVLSEADITINLLDSNDNSPVFVTSPVVFSVSEDASVGVLVGTLLATDADSGTNKNIAYSLNDDNEFFEVLPTGEVLVKSELDRETRDLHYLTFTATDGGGKATSTTGEITVTDINDNSPTWIRDSYFVATKENDELFELEIQAEDADEGLNSEIEYSILSGEYSDLFVVTNSENNIATLKPNQPLDTETIGVDCVNSDKTISLVVQARDKGNPRLSSDVTVDITIQDTNDNPPIFGSNNPKFAQVGELSRQGTPIATLSAYDEDSCSPNNNIDYSVSGDNSVNFLIDSNGLLQVRNAYLDRDEQELYEVAVMATDFGNPRLSSTFVIQVQLTDTNDEPPVFGNMPADCIIEENSGSDTNICQVTATDNDENSNLEYRIRQYTCYDENNLKVDESECKDWFLMTTVNQTSEQIGMISVAEDDKIDREKVETIDLTIEVEDLNAVEGYSQVVVDVVRITVTDVNDNNPAFQNRQQDSYEIDENTLNTIVGEVSATDADKNENAKITYSVGDQFSDYFIIDSESGEFKTSTSEVYALDRETMGSIISVTFVATDNGSPQLQASISVPVTIRDTNDNEPTITNLPDTITVKEGVISGEELFKVNATDNDEGRNADLKYFILETNVPFVIGETDGVISGEELFK